ncbi:hypothetical protein MML48_9g00001464 [Holotrichia oblita]|uniref:Uncharacterized protein n=1 Tax=Holotrichia oblita TaxID=644536 RepID=A0ACB9SKE1_HOLOL|nr:hypothetical protein MML48_9g00001464 [Holotrichia oblita]
MQRKLECYLTVMYDNQLYPGQVKEVANNTALVSTTEKCGRNWKWPLQSDCIWYYYEDIKKKINKPSQISKRIMDPSRKRCANFTPDEKLHVLSLIKLYKDIIENKKSDTVTWREKETAWENITKQFNASSNVLIKRTKESLKNFYENKKKETRKAAAMERCDRLKTGGGPSSYTTTDPTIDLTMSIINQKSVVGLPSIFDNDAEENEENIVIKFVNVEEENQLDWGDFKASQLKTPVSSKLRQPENNKNWSARRRPTLTNTATVAKKYEEWVDAKKEVTLLQLELLKEEKLQQARNAEQCKEEFELRKEALRLDIEIKKEQLAALRKF